MGWRRSRGTPIARRIGIWGVAAAAAILSVALLLPLAVRIFVRTIVFLSNAYVQAALLISAGGDIWTIATTIGRSMGDAIAGTQALTIIGALVLVGAAALYGLQRLLGSEGESSR